MTFRNANPADLPAIVEIYNSTVAGRMVTADTEPVLVESKKAWFDDHTANRPLWIVEDASNATIGWVSFQSFYGRPAYNGTVEVSIYLDEKHRGKGFGKKILKEAMDRCGTFGIKTLVGFIFLHNVPSLNLFSQLGFEEWARLPNVAELDGIERTVIIMGKRIN